MWLSQQEEFSKGRVPRKSPSGNRGLCVRPPRAPRPTTNSGGSIHITVYVLLGVVRAQLWNPYKAALVYIWAV